MVHFEQNFTIKCSKFSCFYIFLLIYFSSFFIIISLLFYIIIIIEEKEKKIKKMRRIVWLSFLIKMIEFVNHALLPTDHWVQCIVLCPSFIEIWIKLHISPPNEHWTLNDAPRPPILALRAWLSDHCALHRGQSSSGRVRKNGTTMGTVLRIAVLFSFVLCFLAALRRLFGGLFFVLRLKRCGLSLEFSDFRT